MNQRLPSQHQPSKEDDAFERGYIFGRDAVIKRVQQAMLDGKPLDTVLTELTNVNFNRI